MALQTQSAPSLSECRGGITPEVEDLYQKMVAKKPEERFQSMTEVAQAIERCTSKATTGATEALITEDAALREFLQNQSLRESATIMQKQDEIVAEESAQEQTFITDGLGRTVPSMPPTKTSVRTTKGSQRGGARRHQALLYGLGGGAALILLLGLYFVNQKPDGTTARLDSPKRASVEIAADREKTAGFDGSAVSTPSKDEGKNYALQFDGREGFVVIHHDHEPIDPLTIEATVSIPWGGTVGSQLRWEDILRFTSSAAEIVISMKQDSGRGVVLQVSNSTTYLQTAIESTESVQIAVVCERGTYKLFIDGQLIGEKPLGQREPPLAPQEIQLISLGGELGARRFLTGRIDEVRISKVARYSGDYQPQKRLEAEPGTLALYHFDEGEGDDVIDSSGNDNHGKKRGGTWVNADADPLEVPEKSIAE